MKTKALAEPLADRLPAIRASLVEAFAAVAKKHGLKSIDIGRIKYDPRAGNFRSQLEGIDANGIDQDAKRYEQAAAFDAELPKLGHTVKHRRGEDVIVGMTRGGKVLTERDGKRWTWSKDAIKNLVRSKP